MIKKVHFFEFFVKRCLDIVYFYKYTINTKDTTSIQTYGGNEMSVIKAGTVFAGKKSPDIHHEILRTYTENGKTMVEVEQYGSTLKTMEHSRKVIFYANEIAYILKKGLAHIILVR